MKLIKSLLIIIIAFVHLSVFAQKSGSCALCKMDIKDTRFLAKAETKSGTTLSFDATECLVNYLKENEGQIAKSWVSDYNTRSLIPVEDAFFLKSKAIPSPMGAYISAFTLESDAKQMKKLKGGEVMNWMTLKERFKDSKFGSLDHGHHHHSGRIDMYGPAGVMGDHLHHKGGKMLSVRYMNMQMAGNLSGTRKVTDKEVFDTYMVSPQSMSMQMVMISAMFAPTDRITLMAMQSLVSNEMDLSAMMMNGGMKMQRDFSTSSKGLGDLKIGGLVGLLSRTNNSIHLNTFISIPVGNINVTDNTPMKENAKLPYAMQLGSGTYDGILGATYRGSQQNFSWGVQQLNTLRIGNNNSNYSMGNVYLANLWGAFAFHKNVSSSLRLNATKYESILGADIELNPMMIPTANGSNYERQLVRSFFGINALVVKESILLSAEVGAPVYQDNTGVFMNENLTVNAAIKLTL